MNAVITEAEYRKQIGKTTGKAYLFFGEEDYLKNHAVKLTREQLCPEPAFAFFNDVTIDAVDFTVDGLLNAMTSPPMMAEGKLILLRGMELGAMKKEELEPLLESLALLREYDYNTVIIQTAAGFFDAGTQKRPSALLKTVAEVAIPVRFDPITPARLVAWCGKHFAHYGVNAAPEQCQYLISFVGRDMFRLSTEIKKIAHYVLAAGRNVLLREDIDAAAVSEISVDTFGLSNAILARDYRTALDALSVMKFEKAKPELVLGSISNTLCDIYIARVFMNEGRMLADIAPHIKGGEYRAKLAMRAAASTDVARLVRVIGLCAEADGKIKGTGLDNYTVLERLICSL